MKTTAVASGPVVAPGLSPVAAAALAADLAPTEACRAEADYATRLAGRPGLSVEDRLSLRRRRHEWYQRRNVRQAFRAAVAAEIASLRDYLVRLSDAGPGVAEEVRRLSNWLARESRREV